MHCFSSGAALAEAALDLGFYLSMSGIAAFPKSHELRDIFAAAPLDRILVETDAPTSRRRPIAASATSPPIPPTPPAVGAELFGLDYPRRVRRRHHRQFRPALHPRRRWQGGLSMAELRFTILGCGSSGGVPRLGGHWGDCDPESRATPAAAVRCWCSASTRAERPRC
jgi:hypothetical protein